MGSEGLRPLANDSTKAAITMSEEPLLYWKIELLKEDILTADCGKEAKMDSFKGQGHTVHGLMRHVPQSELPSVAPLLNKVRFVESGLADFESIRMTSMRSNAIVKLEHSLGNEPTTQLLRGITCERR